MSPTNTPPFLVLELLVHGAQVLYIDFLDFTTNGIFGISKVWISCHTNPWLGFGTYYSYVLSIVSATHPLHLLAITDSAITLDLKSSTSPFYISLYSLSDTKEVSLFCSSCLSGNTSALVVNHSALSSYLQFFQRAFSKPLALPKKHHVEVGLLFLITNLTIGWSICGL